ncbi:MAG TPA: CDP-alcohol phosphatidyltransferase family protein [Phycisphaerales bacterium]|nr:CDP-alcohol phosphatidyltransferase family protein [Phycisphaerales bacterium]HRQ75288.1 CDP-alcohol phosphatidyltransferase family protein [Phycisphaerales bacterium]
MKNGHEHAARGATRANDSRESRLRGLRRRRVRRRLPPMSVFPTLCTLGNLLAGFAAIHYASKPLGFTGVWGWSGLMLAAVLIFVGMIFDAIDGSVARLTRSTSELGAQLDSLADVVTFGVAPAYMTTMLVSHYLGGVADVRIIGPAADNFYGRVVWAMAAVYVCCTALRLARFNVETPGHDAESHSIFRGLPSPGAAGAVASLILLHQHLLHGKYSGELPAAFARGAALGIPFVMLLCALAMVSTLSYSHVINRHLRGRRSFGYIVWLMVPLVLIVWFWHFVVAAAFCAYALSAPAREGWRWSRQLLFNRSAERP